MTRWTLLLKSLLYYWRPNLAVVAGVVIATAVLGGALIVGDSVRDSLRQMSLDRLGRIDHALAGMRFFREELAAEFQAKSSRTVAPLLVMQGTLEFSTPDRGTTRAGHVQIFGLEERAWGLLETGDILIPADDSIVVSRRVADQLGIAVGDDVSLIVEIPAAIPRDALLGDREQTVTELVLKVSAVADDKSGLARLGFNPTQQLPLNAFVSLDSLQSQTGLAAVARSRRNPIAKPARVNTLLVSLGTDDSQATDLAPEKAETLSNELGQAVTLEDLALRLVPNSEHGYVSLESEQMFLEREIADTALMTGRQLAATLSPVQVYLLNEMRNVDAPEKYSMYSVIAGIDPTAPSPFGPFEFVEGEAGNGLAGNEILVNEWLAQDLDLHPDSKVAVKYHVVGDRGELPETEQVFNVMGVVKLAGPALDRGYAPDVPGVTDAETYAEWREPFPLKRNLITGRDDDYWEEYRTTPKIFISLETAQSLWQSRYGDLTSIRMAPPQGQSLEEFQDRFAKALLEQLTPEQTQLVFQPVKHQGLAAAAGTTDFTGLFMGFSFFLILAAVILIALLFRLAVELRGREFGLLQAVGLPDKTVRRLALGEGSLLALVGGGLGVAAAIGYAALMIHGLKTWWIGAIGTKFLFLSVHPQAVATGSVIAVVVALLAVLWAIRQMKSLTSRELLQGNAGAEDAARRSGWSAWTAPLAIGGGLLMLTLALTGVIPQQEAFGGFSWRVVTFFVVGVLLLVGGLSLLSAVLARDSGGGRLAVEGSGLVSRLRLALRNASRRKARSVLTTSLIAWATFVLVAVAAGKMNPSSTAPDPRSGNGGFTLVGETNVPILYDLNTDAGRASLGFDPTDEAANHLLGSLRVMPFRVKPGENASCLNLYQTQLPTILGVPADVLEDMIEKSRFTFADTPGDQPWRLIEGTRSGGAIPVLGDMNTLMYSLHKGIGATIEVPDTDGPGGTLQLAGMFAGSVFQGVLVMSEENFRRLFPDITGFSYFLVEVDPANAGAASELLESKLGDYGFDAERVADRIADFLAVQNTYLSTFQTLGGLGLLLGTVGLAVVMLRNVIERRAEIALLRAVGLQQGDVGLLVLLENALLLAWGLCCGTVSALLAMSPHLLSTAAAVPWGSLLALLAAVFCFGMLGALIATQAATRTPILSTLRGD